jgi:hypothetical protein
MVSRSSLFGAFLAYQLAYFMARNMFLCGLSFSRLPPPNPLPTVFKEHGVLDEHLQFYFDSGSSLHTREERQADHPRYRNHCLRVLSLAVWHLQKSNYQPTAHDVNVMALALAYHDIGLWSDGQLSYLEPSAQQLTQRITKMQADAYANNYMPPWSDVDIIIATQIVHQHHKYTHWTCCNESTTTTTEFKKTEKESSVHNFSLAPSPSVVAGLSPAQRVRVEALVNAVRKADWEDATYGLVRYDDLPANTLLPYLYQQLPDLGFHTMLMNMGSRLSPHSLTKQLDVLQILKW